MKDGYVKKYDKIMAKQTNSELVEKHNPKTDEYPPEALSAAKAELENQNLSIDEMELATQSAQSEEQAKVGRANVPLAYGEKLFTFFFPGVLFPLARELKAKGYVQKYKGICRWTLAGWAFYVILMVALINL